MATDRARQFLAFDALTGLKEYYRKVEKPIVQKRDLMPETKEALLCNLSQIKKGDMVEIIYYDNEDYVKVTGVVTKIDVEKQVITVVKQKIKIDDIYACQIIDSID